MLRRRAGRGSVAAPGNCRNVRVIGSMKEEGRALQPAPTSPSTLWVSQSAGRLEVGDQAGHTLLFKDTRGSFRVERTLCLDPGINGAPEPQLHLRRGRVVEFYPSRRQTSDRVLMPLVVVFPRLEAEVGADLVYRLSPPIGQPLIVLVVHQEGIASKCTTRVGDERRHLVHLGDVRPCVLEIHTLHNAALQSLIELGPVIGNGNSSPRRDELVFSGALGHADLEAFQVCRHANFALGVGQLAKPARWPERENMQSHLVVCATLQLVPQPPQDDLLRVREIPEDVWEIDDVVSRTERTDVSGRDIRQVYGALSHLLDTIVFAAQRTSPMLRAVDVDAALGVLLGKLIPVSGECFSELFEDGLRRLEFTVEVELGLHTKMERGRSTSLTLQPPFLLYELQKVCGKPIMAPALRFNSLWAVPFPRQGSPRCASRNKFRKIAKA